MPGHGTGADHTTERQGQAGPCGPSLARIAPAHEPAGTSDPAHNPNPPLKTSTGDQGVDRSERSRNGGRAPAIGAESHSDRQSAHPQLRTNDATRRPCPYTPRSWTRRWMMGSHPSGEGIIGLVGSTERWGRWVGSWRSCGAVCCGVGWSVIDRPRPCSGIEKN